MLHALQVACAILGIALVLFVAVEVTVAWLARSPGTDPAAAESRPLRFSAVGRHVADLSGAFDDPKLAGRTFFWDVCHLSEDGNDVLPERIAALVLPALKERAAGPRTAH